MQITINLIDFKIKYLYYFSFKKIKNYPKIKNTIYNNISNKLKILEIKCKYLII